MTNEILLPCLAHKRSSTLLKPTTLAALLLEDAAVGFEVEPDDLEAFSRQLGRASSDVRSALNYMQKECAIGPFDRGPLSEIASMFKSGHEDVLSSAKSTLEKLEKILDTSKREMSQSAKYYANTDRSAASRVDATYPTSKR